MCLRFSDFVSYIKIYLYPKQLLLNYMGQRNVFGFWEKDAVPGDMEHMQIQNRNSVQKGHGLESNPGHSCCEVTVLLLQLIYST